MRLSARVARLCAEESTSHAASGQLSTSDSAVALGHMRRGAWVPWGHEPSAFPAVAIRPCASRRLRAPANRNFPPRHPPRKPPGQVLTLGDQTMMNRAGLRSSESRYTHSSTPSRSLIVAAESPCSSYGLETMQGMCPGLKPPVCLRCAGRQDQGERKTHARVTSSSS